MRRIVAVERKLHELKQDQKNLREEHRNIIRNTLILCTKCGKKSKVSSWIFIQRTYMRPRPHGGGDWLFSERDVCDIQCPKCNTEIYLGSYPYREKLLALLKHCFERELFREVKTR